MSRAVESSSLTRCSVDRCRCARLSSASSGTCPRLRLQPVETRRLDPALDHRFDGGLVDHHRLWSGARRRPPGSRTSRIAAPSRIRSPARAVASLTGRSLTNVPLADSRSLTWSTPLSVQRDGAVPARHGRIVELQIALRRAPRDERLPGRQRDDAIGVADDELESRPCVIVRVHPWLGIPGRVYRWPIIAPGRTRMPHADCPSAVARDRPVVQPVSTSRRRRAESAPRPHGSRHIATPPAG